VVSAPDGTGDRRLAVSDALVSSLVRTQFPHLAALELGRRFVVDDHVTIRLGERLCARFPTTLDLDGLVEQSGRWSPPAARDWSFPAGVPLLTGKPTEDYPVHWEIAPWLPGSNATIVELAPSAGPDLGRALRQVHRPTPPDAPPHPSSSRPLSTLRGRWDAARSRLAGEDEPDGVAIDQRSFDSVWAAGVAARPATKAHWIHGNLDPRYIMSDRGKFAGISTWFTFSAGDPAADIGAACVALPVEAEEEFLEGYGDLDAASRDRACAFRLLACVEYATSSNPFLRRIGWQRLAELQSERRSDLRRHA
jgi:aminoglycoside phosphotransferase (APT) family kinase protein